MKKTRLIAVGACAIDTILAVPYFPAEDSKLRATAFTTRRGGNCPNSLEVLQQLVESDVQSNRHEYIPPELHLIAALPARASTQTAFIAASFDRSRHLEHATKVGLSSCLYREDFHEPFSSYIISSQSNSSRTIINHNPLPEMTFDEFVECILVLLELDEVVSTGIEQIWFHFEGRIPVTTLDCIRYLRRLPIFSRDTRQAKHSVQLKISVELEKPQREGLHELTYDADVVFYSRSWAEGEGYADAERCLTHQSRNLESESSRIDKTMFCTWGRGGAYAMSPDPDSISDSENNTNPSESNKQKQITHSPAYVRPEKPIVDTTGAGDTFVAGVLYKLICRDDDSVTCPDQLRDILDFANGLAGRKILQSGFSGLGVLAKRMVSNEDDDMQT